MKITPLNKNSYFYNNNIKPSYANCPKFCSLKCDTFFFNSTDNDKKKLKAFKKEISKLNTKSKTYSQDVFDIIGIKYITDKNGGLIISEYGNKDYSYSDININEKRLFDDIVEIKGDADFEHSKIKNLNNLRSIGGNANFKGSQVIDLGMLENISGDAIFDGSKIKSLGNLKRVGGKLCIMLSDISGYGNLKYIGKGIS